MQITTWTFGRITVAGCLAGLLSAAALFFVAPVHYQSRVVVMVAPASESTNLLMQRLVQRAFSRESLASIIQEHNLYSRERSRMPIDEVIARMQRAVNVVPILPASSSNRGLPGFIVRFDYSDPRVAQAVNAELTSRLLEDNLREAESNPQLESHAIFSVLDPPTLPRVPTSPNRIQFVVVGSFAGLLGGLTLAIFVRSRRSTA